MARVISRIVIVRITYHLINGFLMLHVVRRGFCNLQTSEKIPADLFLAGYNYELVIARDKENLELLTFNF